MLEARSARVSTVDTPRKSLSGITSVCRTVGKWPMIWSRSSPPRARKAGISRPFLFLPAVPLHSCNVVAMHVCESQWVERLPKIVFAKIPVAPDICTIKTTRARDRLGSQAMFNLQKFMKASKSRLTKQISNIAAILVMDLQVIQRHYGRLLALDFRQEYVDRFNQVNDLIGVMASIRDRA